VSEESDVAVVGGGIVGLATAERMSRVHPDCKVAVIEKEDGVAAHQTGHNSGVVHSGIYYSPGSLKARLCVQGGALLREFCRAYGIPLRVRGKLVVATEDYQLAALAELERRGKANSVDGVVTVGPERLREIEPHASGLRALYVPETAVVDFAEVARALAKTITGRGGEIHTGARVLRVRPDAQALVLETTKGPLRTRYLIACAGLYSDRIARLEGADPKARIVPFRGEYYRLVPARSHLVRGLIYPVPDPRFPFLGVHLTRMVNDVVEAGPNAVLALHREGYTKTRLSLRDMSEILSYRGFWKFAARHWRTGLAETARSFSKKAFARSLSRLVPDIREQDLQPADAGVRAQALAPTGELVDDFLIVERSRALHVCNAPSPAATASLAIAREIVSLAGRRFRLGPMTDHLE
jgi:L-2-hydroxyglutarate oxidase LhgO